jgi:hypothetical protein
VIDGRLLVAEGVGERMGGQARGGDAGREPGLVHLCEKTGDLVPAGSLAGFAGIPYEDQVEVEAVAGGVDQAVWSAAEEVAEDG